MFVQQADQLDDFTLQAGSLISDPQPDDFAWRFQRFEVRLQIRLVEQARNH